MLRRTALLPCLVVFFCLISDAASVTPAEVVKWREDLHYFAEQAPQVHKNPYHSLTREQFDAAVKTFDDRIPMLSRDQIVVEIMRIMAMIGESAFLRFVN